MTAPTYHPRCEYCGDMLSINHLCVCAHEACQHVIQDLSSILCREPGCECKAFVVMDLDAPNVPLDLRDFEMFTDMSRESLSVDEALVVLAYRETKLRIATLGTEHPTVPVTQLITGATMANLLRTAKHQLVNIFERVPREGR